MLCAAKYSSYLSGKSLKNRSSTWALRTAVRPWKKNGTIYGKIRESNGSRDGKVFTWAKLGRSAEKKTKQSRNWKWGDRFHFTNWSLVANYNRIQVADIIRWMMKPVGPISSSKRQLYCGKQPNPMMSSCSAALRWLVPCFKSSS